MKRALLVALLFLLGSLPVQAVESTAGTTTSSKSATEAVASKPKATTAKVTTAKKVVAKKKVASKKAVTKKTAKKKVATTSKKKKAVASTKTKAKSKKVASSKKAVSSKKKVASATKTKKKRAVATAAAVGAVAAAPAVAKAAGPTRPPQLASNHAVIVDATTGQPLYAKGASETVAIASITKLMTAMVVLDAGLSLNEKLTITTDDIDRLKGSHSRVLIGSQHSRYEMLRLALMSSENRAASALGRHYPGGRAAFVRAMENKARALGMTRTQFADSTGLSPRNRASAEDLVKMVRAASEYPLIREFSTTPEREVRFQRPNSYVLGFRNTNALVKNDRWDITVSKTGYTQEAGRCLVMMTRVANRPVVMVLLDSQGKLSPVGDANRVKQWMESSSFARAPAARPARPQADTASLPVHRA